MIDRAIYSYDNKEWSSDRKTSYKSLDNDVDGFDEPMVCLGEVGTTFEYRVCTEYFSTDLVCERPIIFPNGACYDDTDCSHEETCFNWQCERLVIRKEVKCSFNLPIMTTTSIIETVTTEYITTSQTLTSNSTVNPTTGFDNITTPYYNVTSTPYYTTTPVLPTTEQVTKQTNCHIDGFPEDLFLGADDLVVADGIQDHALHFDGSGNFSTFLYDMPCPFLPYKCTNGLTVSLWIKPTHAELEDQGLAYFVSSGAPSRTGFAIYRQNRDIHIVVNTDNSTWETVISHNTLMTDVWSSIAFTWGPRIVADVTTVESQTSVTMEENSTLSPTSTMEPQSSATMTTKAPFSDVVLSAFIDGEFISQCNTSSAISVNESTRLLVIGGYYDADTDVFKHSMLGLLDELFISDQNNQSGIDLLHGVDLDACKTANDCDNGTCFTSAGDRECRCYPGFEGDACESDVVECASSPCFNGTCLEGQNEFTCDCLENWGGMFCEKNLCPAVNYNEDVKELTFYNTSCNGTIEVFINPVYTASKAYKTFSNVLGSGSTAIDIIISTEDGRGGGCTVDPVLTSENASYKLEDLKTCIDSPSSCANGFAMSVWIKVERDNSTINETLYGVVLDTKKGSEGVRIRFSGSQHLVVEVFNGTDNLKTVSTDFRLVEDFWFNIGISWRNDLGISIYINGDLQQATVKVTDFVNGDDGELNIGSLTGSRSLFPMSISDIVIWNRYLFEFESYRFIGLTASEMLYLFTSKYYITTDKFIRRDQLAIFNMTTATSPVLDMYVPSNVDPPTVTGRDVKGLALELRGSTSLETIFSDELPGTCISDPSQCSNGFTASIWAKIFEPENEPENDKYVFIFSSGEQASRGMSMYIRMRQQLSVAVTDGDARWIIDLAYVPHHTEWVHFAISWHKDIGLFLYINGKPRGLDNLSYRKIRANDLHQRLTIGRRNDVNCMQSHIIFEDFVFSEKFVAPFEAMTSFGLPDTRNFKDPVLFYNVHTLVGSDLDLLNIDESVRQTLGPSGTKISIEGSKIIEYLQLSESEIVLGIPSETVCFNNPDLCAEGISLSVWVKLAGNMSILRSPGISITIVDDVLNCTIGNPQHTEAQTNINNINTTWINIAVTWSKLNSLDVYINGDLFNSTVYTISVASPNETTIGEITDPGLAIFNLAFWDRFTYKRHSAKFLGITETQLTCVREANYCWPFESALSLVYPYTISPEGISYTIDRNEEGRAIATDGISGWISLGNFDSCPGDPSLCTAGFALSMWLKIGATQNGHLFSVGGKNTTKGVWIQQQFDVAFVEVANGTHISRVDIPALTLHEWFRLGLSWTATSGLLVSINGEAFAKQEPFSANGRSTNFSTEMFLGKVSGFNGNYVIAEYDEVELYQSSNVPDTTSLSGTNESTQYETADEYYVIANDIVGAVHYTPYENSAFDYIDLGDFAKRCLSVLERCSSAGVTMSVWFKPATATFTDPETNSEGRGYIISSGAQNNQSTGFAVWYNGTVITAVAKNESHHWETMASFPFVAETWSNVGFTWSISSGLGLFIDGELQSSDLIGNVTSPCSTDVHTRLILGRRNDAYDGFLSALFKDPAIWYYDITTHNQDAGVIILGNDPEAIIITDNHAELDALSPFIGQECNIIHDADCSRDLQELLSIINGEEEVSPELVESSKNRLLGFMVEQENLTVTDLITMLEIFEFLVNVPIIGDYNETSATTELQDYLTIVSESLIKQNNPEWIALQEIRPGTSSLIQDLEDYVTQISKYTRDSDGHNYMLLTSPEIVVEIRSFAINTFKDDGYIYPLFNSELPDKNSSQFWQTNNNWCKLPKNLFTFTKSGNVASIVFTLYNSLETVFPNITSEKFVKTKDQKPILNSKIMSISVHPPLRMNLYNPFILTMDHLLTPQEIDNKTTFTAVCAFWNYKLRKVGVNNSDGAWDKEGCDVIDTNDTFTTCQCYHFTSFAIFMEPKETISNDDEIRIMWIMTICSTLSIILCIVLIAYYIFTSRLKTIIYNINLNLCWAVLFNCIGLIVSGILRDNEDACRFVGLSLHTTFLAVINWSLIGVILIYCTLENNDDDDDDDDDDKKQDNAQVNCFSEKFSLYFVVGWGVPMLISTTTFAITRDSGYGKQLRGLCFLSDEDSIPTALTIPLIIASLIIFPLVYIIHRNISDETRRFDYSTSLRSGAKGAFILTVYCCVTWVFGRIGLYGNTIWADYLFSVFISFLGVAVFCVQGFLNKEVHAILCWLDPDVELTEIQQIEIKPEPEERPKLMYHP
ncbi:uncharacterized protein [Antedon mediterranea]|uniref:uncharacterized protein n=1 Tax=Antedon mediterranea TaxID=105859 RepID=UPI003AF5F923